MDTNTFESDINDILNSIKNDLSSQVAVIFTISLIFSPFSIAFSAFFVTLGIGESMYYLNCSGNKKSWKAGDRFLLALAALLGWYIGQRFVMRKKIKMTEEDYKLTKDEIKGLVSKLDKMIKKTKNKKANLKIYMPK